jgi:hypothetical protein
MKAISRCHLCGVEHKGRCHALRRAKSRVTPPEKVLEYLERQRERNLIRKAQMLITELCDVIDETRRQVRRETSKVYATKNKSRVALGANRRKAKRDTLTRNRTKQD